MNLSMKNNTENDETENIVPLGNNDIKSVLQKQSESVFEEKNISSKTDFIKKSLIEIALDFETKTKKDNNDIPNKSESPKDLDGNEIEKIEDENNTALSENQSVTNTPDSSEEEATARSNEDVTETSKIEDAEVNINNNNENQENSENLDIENNSLGNKDPDIIQSEQIDSNKAISNDVSR